MCGRIALSLNKEQVRCACAYKTKSGGMNKKPAWIDEHNDGKEYVPSYNLAPTDITPVLIGSRNGHILQPMMWGIIPPWHKDDYRSHHLSTNNCRLENVKASKLYGPILRNGGRCVIVAEGFYEWKTTKNTAKVKQPYYIYTPQFVDTKIDEPATWNYNEEDGWKGVKLLHMAGLYHVWQNGNTVIFSYSIITMESNDSFNWLHHRIPAILETQEQIDMWLDLENVDADMATSSLKACSILSWHAVSTLVNNSRNKSSDCKKKKQKCNNGTQRDLTAWITKTEKRKSTDELMSYVLNKKK